MDLTSGDAWSRIQHFGLKAVGTVDLLTVLLARDERDVEANERVAQELARRYPGAKLADLSAVDLKDAAGLEAYEAHRLLAAFELGRRVAGQGKQMVREVNDQKSAYLLFKDLENEKQEHFCAAFLNSKNGVISRRTIHIGTVNMSVVGAREVFREAVRENAASVIVAHNHPSGDPEPSPEDIQVTQRLKEVGETLDIPVLDHIIVGHDRYVSFYELGLL